MSVHIPSFLLKEFDSPEWPLPRRETNIGDECLVVLGHFIGEIQPEGTYGWFVATLVEVIDVPAGDYFGKEQVFVFSNGVALQGEWWECYPAHLAYE